MITIGRSYLLITAKISSVISSCLLTMMLVQRIWYWMNPFHPNISMHILLTVPYTFPKVLMRRICFIIQSFSYW